MLDSTFSFFFLASPLQDHCLIAECLRTNNSYELSISTVVCCIFCYWALCCCKASSNLRESAAHVPWSTAPGAVLDLSLSNFDSRSGRPCKIRYTKRLHMHALMRRKTREIRNDFCLLCLPVGRRSRASSKWMMSCWLLSKTCLLCCSSCVSCLNLTPCCSYSKACCSCTMVCCTRRSTGSKPQ